MEATGIPRACADGRRVMRVSGAIQGSIARARLILGRNEAPNEYAHVVRGAKECNGVISAKGTKFEWVTLENHRSSKLPLARVSIQALPPMS